jgi:hypothetical protein
VLDTAVIRKEIHYLSLMCLFLEKPFFGDFLGADLATLSKVLII